MTLKETVDSYVLLLLWQNSESNSTNMYNKSIYKQRNPQKSGFALIGLT